MRLFVAVDINDDAHKAVVRLQRELRGRIKSGGIKWVEPENMHLTLKFLGEVEDRKLDEVVAAIEIACVDKKPFKIDLSILGTFGKPAKVLWLGEKKVSSDILKLAADLDDAFVQLGFQREDKPFSTHLTLCRIKDSGTDKVLRKLLDEMPVPVIPPVIVDSVCLYKSQLTQAGPVYTLLNKIELKKDI